MWQAGYKKIQIQTQTQIQRQIQEHRTAYDVICFWKGDDNRSLIMKSEQNMQNISPMFFLLKDQKSKISESESRPFDLVYMKVNSILWAFKGHLIVLLLYI